MPSSDFPEAQRPAGTGPAPSASAIEAADGAAAPGSGMDPEDLAVSILGRLFRLAPRLVGLLDYGAREYGLGFARGRVLWALRESGPVLMRALSQSLGVSPRTVTGLVDALEAEGWVTRSPHPSDRRATVVSITPAADSALTRLDEAWHGLARGLLAGMPVTQLAHCRETIGQIEERLDDAVTQVEPSFRTGHRTHQAARGTHQAARGTHQAARGAGRPRSR
jgi:DNA-binding MarR family transcriptional regulator